MWPAPYPARRIPSGTRVVHNTAGLTPRRYRDDDFGRGQAMSLPAYQQRVLEAIENALKHREPRLTAMFAMFTRLNTSERIPRIEHLEAPPWWAWRRRGHLRHLSHPAAVRVMLLIPLAAMLVVTALFVSMTTSPAPCVPADGAHGPVAAPSHTKTCPSVYGFRSFGHGP